MPAPISPEVRRAYQWHRQAGATIVNAAARVGISERTAYRLEAGADVRCILCGHEVGKDPA